MKKKINLPKFKNEEQERKYWSKINLADHFNAKDFSRVSFPNLKPTSRPVSIRIPEYLLIRVKERANEIDVPYQSLIKEYIKQGIVNN